MQRRHGKLQKLLKLIVKSRFDNWMSENCQEIQDKNGGLFVVGFERPKRYTCISWSVLK